MLFMFFLSLFGSLVLCCVLFPSLWTSITAGDEMLDAHEAGIALVAYRTSHYSPPCCPRAHSLSVGAPFREAGPPACMAKLIMLRHKVGSTLWVVSTGIEPHASSTQINQDKTRKRASVSRARQATFTYSIPSVRSSRDLPFMRFGRMRGKQNH